MRAPRIGDRVVVERDEIRYPSKGTWPQFRGRTGTVVEVNRGRKRPHLTEYGVPFTKTSPHPDRPGKLRHGDIVTWFKRYEVRQIGVLASESHADDGQADGGW